jgi:hypothetical protein
VRCPRRGEHTCGYAGRIGATIKTRKASAAAGQIEGGIEQGGAAVKAIEYLERLGQQWTAYVMWCFNAPYAAPICQPFWTWVALGAATAGCVGLAWIAWKYMDYRAKYREALRAQAALDDVADIQTMDSVKWNGDNVVIDSSGDPNVAEQIREALERRKLGLDKPNLRQDVS